MVRVSGTWYSGTNDDWYDQYWNLNTSITGNDRHGWYFFYLCENMPAVINLRTFGHYCQQEYKVDKEGKKYKLSDFGDFDFDTVPIGIYVIIMRNQKSILFQRRSNVFLCTILFLVRVRLICFLQRCKSRSDRSMDATRYDDPYRLGSYRYIGDAALM